MEKQSPKYDIFISYSRKDSVCADHICKVFDKVGITYFIDRQGIGGGMEFPLIIADAICDSEIFLFLASENSYNSKFANNEITFAFNEKSRQSILPYIIDGSDLPRHMRLIFAGINWRNLKDHPIETVLIDDLKSLLRKQNYVSFSENKELVNHGKSEVENKLKPKTIGRNDPCPCGSGKSYKNCHGKNI